MVSRDLEDEHREEIWTSPRSVGDWMMIHHTAREAFDAVVHRQTLD